MKNLTMLVWLTQLGLSVAVPPVCSIWLAVWLRNSQGLGDWIVWVGIAFGIICAADGLRVSLLAMERLNKNKEEKEPPAVSFNDHD
jgi:hypothetical protein